MSTGRPPKSEEGLGARDYQLQAAVHARHAVALRHRVAVPQAEVRRGNTLPERREPERQEQGVSNAVACGCRKITLRRKFRL